MKGCDEACCARREVCLVNCVAKIGAPPVLIFFHLPSKANESAR